MIFLSRFDLDRASSENTDPDAELRIERLLTNELSTSQIDLVMHGDDEFAPRHVKPRKYDSKIRQNDSKHSKIFLETEKNGGAIRKPQIQITPNQIHIEHSDEPMTEMSTL